MAIYKNYQQTNLLGLEILPSHWEVKKLSIYFQLVEVESYLKRN
ncbi:hypothetical protein D782_3936 [Enterobacteriaceae bacterium strain FGI 57]|nr:hypothetical protein D782_3936 [Enterobacteriaceae bacterium strain FGI 57]